MRPGTRPGGRLGGGARVPLALRNLLANKRRLIRSSAGIGFAVLLMLVQLGFEQGFFTASLAMVRQIDGDLIVQSATKYQFHSRDPFAAADISRAEKVAGIASVVPLYGSWFDMEWQPPGGTQTYLVQTLAFDPDHPPLLSSEIRAESGKLKQADAVIVDRRARPFLGMADAKGDAEINGHTVHVVGSFGIGPDFQSDGSVMMSAETFARLLPGNQAPVAPLPVEFGVVKLKAGEDPARVQAALRQALGSDVRVLTKSQFVELERAFQAEMSSAGPIFWMGTVVGFVVGLLISYQIIYTDLSDQLPQYATLKGIGYNNAYLVRVVLGQATLSALAGYIPAWLLCLVVYRIIGSVALLPLHMTLWLTLLSLALTVGMCLFSALLAIRRVIAADPAEVF
ncbi:MAG: FtsX-like permease family protein [Thiohalocapsa sp.]